MHILLAVVVLWGALVAPAAGEILYGADGGMGSSSSLYILDPGNGARLATVGSIGFAVTGLAVHPTTGVLYGATSRKSENAPGSLIRIDKTTGAGTVVGPFNLPLPTPSDIPETLADITFTSDGTLYGWAAQNGGLYSVNLGTGAATAIGPAPDLGGSPIGGGLAADGRNDLFLAALGDSGALLTLNRQTGQTTPGPTLNGSLDESISALAFDASGVLFGVRLFTATVPINTAQLITIDVTTGQLAVRGTSEPLLDAIAFDPSGTPPPTHASLVASVLPSSRSVQMNAPATAFATIIATGTGTAIDCSIAPINAPPGTAFTYQTTDSSTNQPTGSPNTAVAIPAGRAQSFVIALTPSAPLATDIQLSFDCANTDPAPLITGVDTLFLSSAPGPVPDVIALAGTPTNDGIANIPGPGGTGFFVVATSNVGASGRITATADLGGAQLPVGLAVCRTDPVTSVCVDGPAPSVTAQINAGETPTFAVFVQGGGDVVPFNPAVNRVFVRFRDEAGGATRGSTSVAIRTQ